MIPVIIGVTIIALIAGLMVSKYLHFEGFAVQKGSGPGSDAQYALDVMNFTEMKELPGKYNSGELKFTPEQLVSRVISLMNYPRDNYYNSHKAEFISPDWPGVLADYFYNIMIPQISPDKRPAVQTKVDSYMTNIIKGKLVPALQGVSTAPVPASVSGASASGASVSGASASGASVSGASASGASVSGASAAPLRRTGPGSDAQYALDVMNFTEMKELPGKFNSGAITDPEGLVNRAIQLMNYPREAYYNAHKTEFTSPDWPGVMADYFYNIMLPQIDLAKRSTVQTKVDWYMKNIVKGKLVPQLQGPNTAPLPPEVSGGSAVASSPSTITQAPATTSNVVPSASATPTQTTIVPSSGSFSISSTEASLPAVPRDNPQTITNITPKASLTATPQATTTMQGSSPAPFEATTPQIVNVPTVTAPNNQTFGPVPTMTVTPSTMMTSAIAPSVFEQTPLALTTRILSNDEIKTGMDLILNVLSPNSLGDLTAYDTFIQSLPGSFINAVDIYKEDYFTKTNAPTLQFIDTIYRLYKPFESKYYLIAGQSPVIPFDRTFKVYMATMTNEAKIQLRYQASQIKALENSLLTWIPPANRNAAQPVITTALYPAAASPSYFIPPNMVSLAESIKTTVRNQLNELKIAAGVTTAPTTGSASEVSPALLQGFMDYRRRNKSNCPNCYPTPWTPDNIPFNPSDYIRKDKIPCAQCRLP